MAGWVGCDALHSQDRQPRAFSFCLEAEAPAMPAVAAPVVVPSGSARFRATRPAELVLAPPGQLARLLDPTGELLLVEGVVLVDVEVAHVIRLRFSGRQWLQ
jgi:hypothetical protein